MGRALQGEGRPRGGRRGAGALRVFAERFYGRYDGGIMCRHIKARDGMASSRAGRKRAEKTAELKDYSKKARRRQARARVSEGLREP